MGFRPTTTEFHSDALTDWAFRSWVQLAIRANFVQLLQFHRLFSVGFHFGYCLRESSRLFSSKFSWVNHMSVAEWIDKQDIHHWRILWSSYIKLAWVGTLTHNHWIPFRCSNRLSYQAMSLTRTQSQLCTTTPISSFAQFQISFRLFPSSVSMFILIKIFLRCLVYIFNEKTFRKLWLYFSTLSESSIFRGGSWERGGWLRI